MPKISRSHVQQAEESLKSLDKSKEKLLEASRILFDNGFFKQSKDLAEVSIKLGKLGEEGDILNKIRRQMQEGPRPLDRVRERYPLDPDNDIIGRVRRQMQEKSNLLDRGGVVIPPDFIVPEEVSSSENSSDEPEHYFGWLDPYSVYGTISFELDKIGSKSEGVYPFFNTDHQGQPEDNTYPQSEIKKLLKNIDKIRIYIVGDNPISNESLKIFKDTGNKKAIISGGTIKNNILVVEPEDIRKHMEHARDY